MNIKIRPVSDLKDIYPILDLMKDIWSLSELEIVASFEMKAVSTFGILLGAYDLDNNTKKPIGFIYGFPKFPDAHYSHQMGIDKHYQSKSVGFLLKQAHRELALRSTNPEINSIEWTVDPLLSANAMLNFRKLGVICNTYYPNFYGDPDGAVDLYPSVPTDRILVEWKIRVKRVNDRFDNNIKRKPDWKTLGDVKKEIKFIQESKFKNGYLEPPTINSCSKLLESNELCIEIPNEYTKKSKKNLGWALKWREGFRDICIKLFKENYYLVDFFSFKNVKTRRNILIFTRTPDEYKY